MGTTTWASTNAQKLYYAQYGSSNVVSCNQAISANGQFVTFEVLSTAGNGIRLSRYNTQTGATEMVFTNANYQTGQPFQDIRTLANDPGWKFYRIHRKWYWFQSPDLSPATCRPGQIFWVSRNQTGGVPTTATSDAPTVDPTGRCLAFTFFMDKPVDCKLCVERIRYPEAISGRGKQGKLAMIGLSTNGVGVGVPHGYVMSDNAQFFSFDSANSGLVPNDSQSLQCGCFRRRHRGRNEWVYSSYPIPTNRYRRRMVTACYFLRRSVQTADIFAFASDADNLVANDTNTGCRDVFVRDTLLQTNILVEWGWMVLLEEIHSFRILPFPPSHP